MEGESLATLLEDEPVNTIIDAFLALGETGTLTLLISNRNCPINM
jgi:hypothetical protein